MTTEEIEEEQLETKAVDSVLELIGIVTSLFEGHEFPPEDIEEQKEERLSELLELINDGEVSVEDLEKFVTFMESLNVYAKGAVLVVKPKTS